MTTLEEIKIEKAAPGNEPQVVLYGPVTAGWRTGGHDWRFKRVTATVTVPEQMPAPQPHPDATIALFGYTQNPYFLAIGIPAGTGGRAWYDYDIGTASSQNQHVPFDIPALNAGDTVRMEILHNHARHQEEFTVTVNPGTPAAVKKIVTVVIPEEHNDQVFYRHAGWDVYLDGNTAELPGDYDLRLWKYHECHATSEGPHGERDGGIFGPWDALPEDRWATWREIVTREGSPTGDVVVLPGTPWPEAGWDNFGMIVKPERHPTPVIYGTTTAGWRTGGRDWQFKKITATVKIPGLPPGYPEATIGLQGFMENPYGLSIGISGDSGSGASAHYGYDFGDVLRDLSIPFGMPLQAGDAVKMEILHNSAAAEEVFTIIKAPGTPGEQRETHTVRIPSGLNVAYGHAGWNSYLDGDKFPVPAQDERLWLFRDCHVTSEGVHGEITGNIFGPWQTWRQIVTRGGVTTAEVVLLPRWPWPEEDRDNFGMILHRAVTQAEPMVYTWFPDAGAGASADGLALVAKQVTDLAAAGFGGAVIGFLSDNTDYPNGDAHTIGAKTIGFGSENWRRVLKQILRTANGISRGFGIDLMVSSHWPPAVNNIDPNDDAQQQQLVGAWAKITAADLASGAKDLPLPRCQRTRDTTTRGGDGARSADFLFADKFVAATVAKVTGFTDTHTVPIPILEIASLADVSAPTVRKTITDAQAAAGIPYREEGGAKCAGCAAGIPDCDCGHDDPACNVCAQWGPKPSDPSFPGKIDNDGNRKRMADWQYLYQTDISGVPVLAGYTPSSGDGLAVGDFILFGTYREGNGQVMNGVGSITQYNRSYIVSLYDSAGVQAIADFWQKHILDDEMIELLKTNAARNPSAAVSDDSLRYEVFNTGPLWTPDLPDVISSATGYAAAKYAPVFAGSPGVTFDDPVRAGRLHEDRTTALAREYENEHIAGMKSWAATFGYTFKAQAEAGARGIAGGEASLGVVEGDNLAAGDGFRNLAAAANLSGTNLVSNESLTFVATDYATPWPPLAAALNSYWGAGVNRVIYHGSHFPKTFNGYHSDWPGWEFPYGASALGVFDARQIYWGDMNQLSGYVARTQAVLQSGRAKVDLAVLEGTDARYTMPGGNSLQGLLNAGYSYNILDEAMLNLPAATVTGGVLAASGPSYRALIVSKVAILSVAAVDKLISYAQAGLPVILYNSPITRVYGTSTPQNSDTSLAQKVQQHLLPLCKVASTETQVIEKLASAGITPAASYSVPGLVSIHRTAQGADHYLLWSEGTTLASSAAEGDTRIRVVNTQGLQVGSKILIGAGAAAETATAASIESAGPGGAVLLTGPLTKAHAGPVYNLASPAAEGDTRIRLVVAPDLQAGDRIVIDTGDAAETVTVASIESSGPGGAVLLGAPLTKAHTGPTSFGTTFAFTLGAGVSAAVGKQITLSGSGAPYTLDAWTGRFTPLAEYTTGPGTVTFELTLPAQATALVVLGGVDGQPAAHAISATGPAGSDGGEVLYTGGKLVHRATIAGTYTVALAGDGTPAFTVAPKPVPSLTGGWDLRLESWGPDPAADAANPTISATTTVSFGSIALGPWPALPASAGQLASLGVASMSQVAGIGTYTRQFDLPAGWAAADGAYLQLAHGNDMVVGVTINGRLLTTDPFTGKLDLGPFLLPGSNTLTVRIDTTLNNRVPGRISQPYGLTGAQLIAYVQTAL